MSDEKTTRAASGVKFSQFKQVGPQEGNPVQVVGLRDGDNVRASLTTDLVETNPGTTFRGANNRAEEIDPGVMALTNQLKVNRYFYERLAELGVPIGEDPPTETPKDGAFWFDNSEDVMQLFMWHAESDAWLPIAPPTTLEGRVATGEATQQAIIEQIQESLVEQREIKDKVNALEGVVGDHSLVFTMDNSNPRAGEFNLKDGAMQITNTLASADYITLSDTDRNGNPIDLDRVTEGDVLRFSSIDGQVAELKITDGTNGVFAFTKVSGELDRLSEYPYDFILLSSFDPAGLATIAYVDERDETKIGNQGVQYLTDDVTWQLRQKDKAGEAQAFITINDGTMGLRNVGEPVFDSDAVNKAYADQNAGGSTFRVVEVNNTIQMKDGDIWIWNDKAYVSWKTLEGRIWCPNPTLEEWKNWPEGTEHGGQTHGRWIPETYMVWESVEDGHPYGMTTVNKVDWKTYLDENGNVIGREGYDTMAIKLTWANPSNYTTYPTFPPVGKIIRVRFAPWL